MHLPLVSQEATRVSKTGQFVAVRILAFIRSIMFVHMFTKKGDMSASLHLWGGPR